MKTFEATPKIYQQLAALPEQPGVYIFKNAESEIVYIGKALSLKSRVRSYWNNTSWLERPKLAVLVPRVEEIEFIVTNSEKDALLLEATLVRQHMPRYNVHLKDDKKYPWLCITYEESFPRLIMIRDPAKHKKAHPKDKVFGPYVETGLMWETVKTLRKVFPMRQRRKPLFKDRPCMNYHIGLCLAPCQNLVEEEFYNKMVEQVELFLSGSQSAAVDRLENEMENAAEALKFEEAARLRDRLYALKSILQKQQVLFKDPKTSIDVIAQSHTDKLTLICMMKVREGKLISSETFDLPLLEKSTAAEAYQSFIKQYYNECEKLSIAKELLLQQDLEDARLIEEILSQKSGRQVKLLVPERGDKFKLLEMCKKTAASTLESLLNEEHGQAAKVQTLLAQIQEELNLASLPRRIECFDISNIQGSDNVASMVVFENAQAKKSDYRTFKIKSVEGEANDFASMNEVVRRRYKRLCEENKPLPDLIIIDGGKGQLNAAVEALTELKILPGSQDIVGLAKKQEEIYKPGRSEPFLLSRRSQTLFLLQRVRDEAHRFAVSFHRKLRAKRSLVSGFDEIPGIGQARRKMLMLHFVNPERMRQATLEEIQKVKGLPPKVAEKIYDYLHKVESDYNQSAADEIK